MKYSNAFVKNIFTDSMQGFRIDMQSIVDITFLLNKKLLILEKKQISTKVIYFKYIEDINSEKISKIDIHGGSINHLALKLVGNKYLEKIGCFDNKYELEFEGYFPDVISQNKKIIVESGNTNPDKIFNYFKNKKLQKLIIIPYPNDTEKFINAYIFTPSAELSDFLDFTEKEKIKDIKKYKSK